MPKRAPGNEVCAPASAAQTKRDRRSEVEQDEAARRRRVEIAAVIAFIAGNPRFFPAARSTAPVAGESPSGV